MPKLLLKLILLNNLARLLKENSYKIFDEVGWYINITNKGNRVE